MKKTHRFPYVFLVLLFSLILTACGGQIPSSSWPGVTVDQSMAYVADGGRVFGINLDGLTQVWVYPAKTDAAKQFYADPALTPDGQLLLGAYNHILYSVDPKTGADRWNFDKSKDRIVGSPLVTKNGIYLPSTDYNLYALDFNGNQKWAPFKGNNGFWTQPASDGTTLYVPSMDHFLYALNEADGRLIWKKDLGAAIPGTPTLSEDGKQLYVGTLGKQIFALDSASGKILWQKPVDGAVWSGPALLDKRLFFGALDGGFYIVDQGNGSLVKKVSLDGSITGAPLVDKDTLVVATGNGNLAAISPDGTVKWNVPIGGKLYTGPKLVGDHYLIAFTQSTDKLLEYVDRNGKVLGTPFNLPK